MFENPRRARQARKFTTNVSKILDFKSSSEQIFFRKLSLGAPGGSYNATGVNKTFHQGRHENLKTGYSIGQRNWMNDKTINGLFSKANENGGFREHLT